VNIPIFSPIPLPTHGAEFSSGVADGFSAVAAFGNQSLSTNDAKYIRLRDMHKITATGT